MNFREITLDDKKIFDKYETALHQYYGCEYSFALNFVENALGGTQICEIDDIVIIRTKWSGERVYFPPLLNDIAKLPDAIRVIEQQAQIENAPFNLSMISNPLVELLDTNRYIIAENRWLADYIYNANDLIHLSGKQFHSKRNFISRFEKTYDYTFRAYDESADREAILNLLQKWDNNTEHEKWDTEDKLIEQALNYFRELDLKIAVLYVKTELIAFSISSIRNDEIAYTFFEKANTEFIGAYQVINQRTAEMFFQNVKYVNRQCDMDVEGLRKAKLSYNPIMLINKYKVQLRN